VLRIGGGHFKPALNSILPAHLPAERCRRVPALLFHGLFAWVSSANCQRGSVCCARQQARNRRIYRQIWGFLRFKLFVEDLEVAKQCYRVVFGLAADYSNVNCAKYC
jgi:hypothetical protein